MGFGDTDDATYRMIIMAACVILPIIAMIISAQKCLVKVEVGLFCAFGFAFMFTQLFEMSQGATPLKMDEGSIPLVRAKSPIKKGR